MTCPSSAPQNIHVILNPNDGEDLYIDIPYDEVQRLSRSPSRLLHYFCFIVLGLPGTLHVADGRRIFLERKEDGLGINIEAGGTYIYLLKATVSCIEIFTTSHSLYDHLL